MGFEPLAEIQVAPELASVYEEGWQSWSPVRVLRGDQSPPRPRDATHRTMGWRSDRPLPERGFQGEGILGVSVPDGPVRVWFATAGVPSIRVELLQDRLLVSTDGPVDEVVAPTLEQGLAQVGERLRRGEPRSIPPGWSTWSCYFTEVTEADVAANVAAADRLDLPIEIVQLDDGWQAEIGDWLDVSPRFGSLEATAERIVQSSRLPGIWTAPFLVGERSRLAREHPDWLVAGADAGGAPLLPSVGLVDAMRIGPDVIGITDDPKRMSADIEQARVTTTARAWMQARLWTNDPDHLLVRPGIAVRDAWAEQSQAAAA
jgi:alpha-galactosidase